MIAAFFLSIPRKKEIVIFYNIARGFKLGDTIHYPIQYASQGLKPRAMLLYCLILYVS